jgi:asparagine synthase (glutamine-hydrolysing)
MLTDRMTMAHGLELRSPFLDHELVTYMATFPRQMKINGRELKYVLRKLGRDYLPDEIVKRDKQGFMFPVAYWFRHSLYSFIKGYLLDSPLVTGGLFREEAVLKLIEDHRHNRVDNHVRLWMLLNLTIWQKMYIEGMSPADVREELLAYL